MNHALSPFVLASILTLASCAPQTSSTEPPPPGPETVELFLGNWGLYLPDGAGWLSVRQEDGFLDGELLWESGSVEPVAHMFFADGILFVTRIDEESPSEDSAREFTITDWLELRVEGDSLSGQGFFPHLDGQGISVVPFIAKRIHDLPPAPDLESLTFGEPIELFNGQDLSGWIADDPERANGWSAESGMLVNNPVQPEGAEDDEHPDHVDYANIRTVNTFGDFNLTLEVNFPEGSNSGIYLRGIYEVQVEDTYGKGLHPHNMGAIYSRITPSAAAEKPAGEWQSFDITLADRHVTVILNDTKIIDNVPLPGVTGGALTADQDSPGPILLQGDHGEVSYRNIVLRPIVK